jgi:hypothetical protein
LCDSRKLLLQEEVAVRVYSIACSCLVYCRFWKLLLQEEVAVRVYSIACSRLVYCRFWKLLLQEEVAVLITHNPVTTVVLAFQGHCVTAAASAAGGGCVAEKKATFIGKGRSQGVIGKTGIIIKYSSKMTFGKKLDRILLRRGTNPMTPWERRLPMNIAAVASFVDINVNTESSGNKSKN